VNPADSTDTKAVIGPVPQSERIDSIDVLRGVALLGILVINIQSFSMIGAIYLNPTASGDLAGSNYVIWLASHLLFDHKMMPIFAMLFGAGIVLMSSRREEKGLRPAGLHYRRMTVLFVFGLLHGHGLWHGDILYHYAWCGMIVYLFRRRSPRLLIALAVIVYSVAPGLTVLFEKSMVYWPPEDFQEVAQFWAPSEQQVAEETAAYRGNWLEQCRHRVPMVIFMQTFVFPTEVFWDSAGLMLFGMALFKLGVFSAQRSARFYVALIAAGILVGIPIVFYGVQRNFAAGWDFQACFFSGRRPNTFGSIFVSLAWVGLVMLMCKYHKLPRATRALAAVGRMALTNYLLQTVICTTIFYGHGLGLFGQVERLGQIAILVSVWAFQLAVSPVWLRYFRFGPAEWLWRSLSYLKIQPILRKAS
jgi:uncharacterized protein